MRRFSNLPEDYRKFVLTMISHDINNIKSSAEIVKRFLTRLIMSLLENEKFEDSQYADNIIPLIHKIFLDLKNDPISIQKITSPKLVDGLLDLLESEVVGLRDKHTVIEILAIMACNSDIISQALMRKSAVRTLSQFNDEYHAK